MAQTERSNTDILSLLANNTTGAISPQDLRDALASMQGYGSLVQFVPGGDTMSGVNTNYDANSIIDIYNQEVKSIDVNSSGVTVDNANGIITVGSTGIYRVAFHASFKSDTVNRLFTFRLHKDATADQLTVQRYIGTGGDVGAVACEGIFSLTAGEVLDMRVIVDTGTVLLTFESCGLVVHRLG